MRSIAITETATETAAFIRTLRTALCITQEELARLVSVSQFTICRWEAANHRPTPRHWRRLNELYYRTVRVS